eukprot:5233901-Lingulodinium_polyedra.AAC.1
MESGICTLEHIQRSCSRNDVGIVQVRMRSLARVVWACREVEVLHRDVKPANCIMYLHLQPGFSCP